MNMNPAIFLDRDGVINEDISVETGREVTSTKDVKIYTEAKSFLKIAKEKGYKIIVVTNQSKVGRGLITIEELENIHKFINESSGRHIHAFYYCPHKRDDGCKCRKPNTGMIEKAAREHSIDLKNSWMVGDKTIDIKAGENMGLKTILVKTGYGGSDKTIDAKPDYVVKHLGEAVKIIFGPSI